MSRVKAHIYGEDYTIVGESDPEYIEKITAYVDARMKELARQNPKYSKTRLAILTAVNIADELHQGKETGEISGLEDRARKLISMLDEGIVGDY